jgi:hypothetical protein
MGIRPKAQFRKDRDQYQSGIDLLATLGMR